MGQPGADLNRPVPAGAGSGSTPLAAAVWPAGRKSLVLHLLAEGGVVPRRVLKAPVEGAARRIVELDAFPLVAVARFDAAVAAGEAEDSAEGFRRFASGFFGRRLAFLSRWVPGDGGGDHLVVPLEALRADPAPWIERILRFTRPGAAWDKSARQAAAARMTEALHQQSTPEDLARFRYYEPGLFDLLGGLNLKREVVQMVFRKTMGREPSEDSLLRLQAAASVQDLRRGLMASREYRRKQAGPDFPTFAEASPDLLKSEDYMRWSRRQKTRLGWPLSQVFVSRRAGLLYCPIGKVACTFLKQQMVRISDVAHSEFILGSVHVRTDGLKTGLQLSDHPEAEARAMMADPSMVRIAVLRNPADRLLSAYIEKFVIGRNEPANIHHTRSLVAAVQARQGLIAAAADPDMDRGISFRAFLEGIAAEAPEALDPHWRPQVLYLQGMIYDHLFALEQIDAVVDLLEARSGLILPRQAQNVTDSGAGTDCPGAADLLPAEILARPRIGKTSFFEADLLALIEECFGEDARLHRAALGEDDRGAGR